MFRKFYFLILLSIAVFASCEDKQSSSDKNHPNLSTEELKKQATEDSIQQYRDSLFKVRKEQMAQKNRGSALENNPMFPIAQEELIPFLTKFGQENPENRVRIKTSFGNIDVELFRDTPLHRANFIMLVKNGYFNNTFFHRVAPGFVIQGGNSDNQLTASMRGDVGRYLIPSETEAGHKHVYGAFSAAKYVEQNVSKASSPFEFFIVMDPEGTPHIDNEHTVFGRVISGMDVAEKISEVKTGQSEWPVNNVEIDIEILK
ncbi:peptidylprolyl isomerase [Gramella sp. AN32]|uniref:Peptidyl-prolyl cis-trans isomerase n=1 Tax=Christiangramia antarctica TaxID=2058158 RepID=A0ABW5XAK8_9FLAO|nr:peptidylprolyl isomerase [Gramella sp. AN32]MCM4156582.1 peptidylprolyl isomerase [Gramella sp. AN32]